MNNGTDYSGVEKFCAVMNLPKPMSKHGVSRGPRGARPPLKS